MSIDYSKFAYPKPAKKVKDKFKKTNKPKHRQTKETDIDTKTKIIVWERDEHKCIFCGKYVNWNFANAHYIPRSAGGLRNSTKLIYSM